MRANRNRTLPLILLLTLGATALQSCKKLPRAVKNRQRLEAEVALTIDASFAATLEGTGPEFRQAIARKVLERADMGLRFYPVLSESYAEGQPRPEYLLTVSLSGLDFDLRRSVKRQKDGDTVTFETTRWLDKVRCTATIQMHKRRGTGPALLVARDMASVDIDVPKPAKWKEGAAVLRIRTSAVTAAEAGLIAKSKREEPAASQTPAPVSLPREILDRAIDDAVQFGMRKVIKPIDHELIIAHRSLQAPAVVAPGLSTPRVSIPSASISSTGAPGVVAPRTGPAAPTTDLRSTQATQTHLHTADANPLGGNPLGANR